MKRNKLLKTAAALCIALASVFFINTDVQAQYVQDTANGVSYEDEVSVSVGYASAHAYGGATSVYVYINTGNTGDRVMNVKSSSSNLLAKKTREEYTKYTSNDWDYDTAKYITTTTMDYGTSYISFFAKKAGSYTVSFDIVDVTGTVRCTKTIKVKARGTSGSTSSVNAIKSFTYAGKDIYTYYPYTTKTKGKVSVKTKKGYSVVSIEVGKKDSKGDYKFTKVKNNKTISLAKSGKYSFDYADGSTSVAYNPLFPITQIRVTVKNNKTKATSQYYAYLCTMNKK